MAKIRLNFNRLPIQEKVARAQQIVTALTGNVSFTTPTPALANITTAATELAAAEAEAQSTRQSAKEKTTARNQKEDSLDQLITQVAAYVESVAGNNEQMILSAGLDPRAQPVAPSAPPDQPQALTPTAGDHDGEIDLSWEPIAGAKSYVIQQSPDPVTPTTWAHADVSTKSSYTASGLQSGTRYWYRVAAVNNFGQNGWSDPATKIAP